MGDVAIGLTISNTNTLSTLFSLTAAGNAIDNTLLSLSTGKQINKAADNPAGLIAVESLKAELASIDQAGNNVARANSLLSTADNALEQITEKLTEIEGLALAATSQSGLTEAEIQANQDQIDLAIAAIDRIVQSTSFNGKRLLDGSLAYKTSNVDSTEVTDLEVHATPYGNASLSFDYAVTQSAQRAQISFSAAGLTASGATIEVIGKDGTSEIAMAGSATQADIEAAINGVKDTTGVSARVSSSVLYIESQEFGADAFVTVEATAGTLTVSAGTDSGQDADVTINGQSASVDGLDVNFAKGGSRLTFTLTEAAGTDTATTGAFNITGGGAKFAIGTGAVGLTTVGINSLFSQRLGNATQGYLNSLKSGGANDLGTNTSQAATVARAALNEATIVRGRLGAFQSNVLDTATSVLNKQFEALDSARSQIEDTDFAKATAELTRNQILFQAGISALSHANNRSALILSLI